MSATLTVKSIEQYVRRMLGSPVVEVELDAEQVEEAANQALGIYGTYKPVEKVKVFQVLQSSQQYTWTQSEIGRGVIEFFQPDLLRTPISLDQFDVFKYHTHLPNLDPGDFYMEKVWWSEVRRSAGSDDDWEWIPDPVNGGGTLYISPPPSQGYNGAVIYVVDPTFTEVPPTDDDWIKEYTLGMCKQILGRIRSKFTGVQGAESTLDMDGETLRAEGTEMRKDLEEYLTGRGQIIAPIRG